MTCPCDHPHGECLTCRCPLLANEKPVVVIACTEESMRAGGFGPLPHDPKSVHRPSDEEKALLVAMFRAFDALRQLGWQDAMYAPRDNSAFLAIEAGSTGIHECTRDNEGRFWVYDGDLWPSRPVLWKPLDEPKTVRVEVEPA